jgi:acyl carrier protein
MTPTPREIEDWIVARVGDLTGIPAGEIDPDAPITRHGLDSVTLIALATDLEKWLGCRFRENPLDRYPTIRALAEHLAGQVDRREGG